MLRVEGLVKRHGEVTALRDFTVSLPAGQARVGQMPAFLLGFAAAGSSWATALGGITRTSRPTAGSRPARA